MNNDLYQLGIILHPPEVINEKFLITLRDCVIKLPQDHPLKKWMKWIGETKAVSKDDLEKQAFLSDVITSQFNLITDAKVKNKIVNILHEVPQKSLPELLLKSYLYLMIGNITRSDNILREFIRTHPRENWVRVPDNNRFYHNLGKTFAPQILRKLSRHPADRKSIELLALYLKKYYNDELLLTLANEVDTSEVENALRLKFVEKLSPSLVKSIRLSNVEDNRKVKFLRDSSFIAFNEQSYWIWTFQNIDPLISDDITPELVRIEKEDELWFIYLMENERMADLFSKKVGKSFLPGRRPFLKKKLDESSSFMMALYKLIELGDINHDLVLKTTEKLTNE